MRNIKGEIFNLHLKESKKCSRRKKGSVRRRMELQREKRE